MNEKPALVALYDGVSDAAVTKAIAAAMTEVAAEHEVLGRHFTVPAAPPLLQQVAHLFCC